MIITAIIPDKKHLTKFEFSDGSHILLDKDIQYEEGLFEGKEFDKNDIKDLKHRSDCKRAKSRALWLLDRMDYSKKNLSEKLVRAGFNKKVTEQVLNNLCELGLVDDLRLAQRVAERLKEENFSENEILRRLYTKGITYEMAREVLCNLDIDEDEQITRLLQGRFAYKIAQPDGVQKVYAALVRRGFSYNSVSNALKKYKDELEFEDL